MINTIDNAAKTSNNTNAKPGLTTELTTGLTVEKGAQIYQGVKEKVSGAYEGASGWMEENSFTLFAIGGGILLAGLVTYFVATRRSKAESADQAVDKAA